MDIGISSLLDSALQLQRSYYCDDKDLIQRLISGLIRKAASLSPPEWAPDQFSKHSLDTRDELVNMVDCMMYALSMLSTQDIDRQALLTLIESRQSMVSHMHETCALIQKLKNQEAALAVLDIDGVIFPYPVLRSEFCASCGANDYETAKEMYRLSGLKAVTPPLKGAKELIDLWHSQGKKVVVVSSRPVERYPEVYLQTLSFFDRFQLDIDLVIFKDAKHVSAELDGLWPQVEYFVDDELPRVELMKKDHPHIKCIHISEGSQYADAGDLYRFESVELFYSYLIKKS